MEQQDDNQFMGTMSTRQFMPYPQESGVVKWRMETSEDLLRFENTLLGRVYNDRTKKYEDPPAGTPVLRVCNNLGVAYARSILVPLITKTNLQGNLTEEALMNLLGLYADDITEHVGKCYVEYEIAPHMRDTFIDSLIAQIRIALTRTIDDKERDYAVTQGRETSNTIQRFMEQPQPQRRFPFF